MNELLQDVCDSLEELSESIINGWSDDRNLIQVHGWHHPALTRHDIGKIPLRISKKIKDVNPNHVDEDLIEDLESIPEKVQLLSSSQLPYFYNGHGKDSIPAFLTTMEWIEAIIQPIVGWQLQNDNKVMPTKIARRLSSLNAQLNEIIPEKEKLEQQIKLINEATETAESLPADLQSLKKARNEVKTISTETTEILSKIKTNATTAKEKLDTIIENESETSGLVDKCEEAYRITTTKGLASAFDQRAKKTSRTMWIWVVTLIAALAGGVYIGANRFEALSESLKNPTPEWGIIWMQMTVSLLSLAAPVWLAWIATKQIGQRFRLAEDYHFKASVAKAYEGYRKEASRLDVQLETRLFDSALTRLEEAPLRLMDKDNHGSPFHELINSPQFEKALDKIPELKDKLIEVTSNVSLLNGKKNGEKKKEVVEETEE